MTCFRSVWMRLSIVLWIEKISSVAIRRRNLKSLCAWYVTVRTCPRDGPIPATGRLAFCCQRRVNFSKSHCGFKSALFVRFWKRFTGSELCLFGRIHWARSFNQRKLYAEVVRVSTCVSDADVKHHLFIRTPPFHVWSLLNRQVAVAPREALSL